MLKVVICDAFPLMIPKYITVVIGYVGINTCMSLAFACQRYPTSTMEVQYLAKLVPVIDGTIQGKGVSMHHTKSNTTIHPTLGHLPKCKDIISQV